jgi:type II secretory pathway component GspD/PulD (secretin)
LDTARFLIKSFGRKPLFIILVSLLFLTSALVEVAPSQVNNADKQKVVRQVAQKWIQVGTEQYKRGFYKAAEQSFLRARDYQEYLIEAEREKLNELVEKTHRAVIERGRILEHIQKADELVKQGEPMKARALLEQARDSEFVTEQERKLITEGLAKLEQQSDERQKEATELYDHSVGFYRAGRLEEAREGFIKLAKSGLSSAPQGERPEDYLVKIDNILAERAEPKARLQEHVQDSTVTVVEDELLEFGAESFQRLEEQEKAALIAEPEPKAPEPAADESSYIKVINRRRNILRSHTRAVFNDVVANARNYISQGEFSKAKEAVETAERTVSKNQLFLGDDLFKQYSDQLQQLNEQIVQGQKQRSQQLQEQKRIEAVAAQSQYREQMETDREKRIAELMQNAVAYQKQQRYDEALGQLESLLAIDPLNDEALILRDTLNDVVNFRKQLEVRKEKDGERLRTLVETDKAMIPYADELTHPKNWREIVASPFRVPDEAIGQNPADAAVYKQLDEIVDLSELTPEMPLSEAIDELKNSVDPPLNVFVNWRDLYDNADIDQTTPINMDPISAISLGTALDLLLEAVSGGFAELRYAVENGVVTIATEESLQIELKTLVYDVTDLLGRPADFWAEAGADVAVGGEGEAGTEQFGEQDERDREELLQEALLRADALIMLIQDTIEPDSWYEAGGEGSITVYENKKLIVHQSLRVHNEISKLLNELRKSLGHQVAIESRFLLVGENFLEDIGLDVDFAWDKGGKTGLITFDQASALHTVPTDTGITGSLPGTITGLGALAGIAVEGGYGNLLLDDLEVHFLLKATQAHRDAKALTAPKVSVLSGESATFRVQRYRRYPYEIEPDIEELGEYGDFRWTIDYEEGYVVSGTLLNITPTIMHDKKHVLLNIVTELRDFLGWQPFDIQLPIIGQGTTGGEVYTILFPETEISRVETRVSVPDGGTLLLGGQKLTSEVERESGVPIVSRIPVIGRLFRNRSMVKDSKILLVLVKPSIILQEEVEAGTIATMEESF